MNNATDIETMTDADLDAVLLDRLLQARGEKLGALRTPGNRARFMIVVRTAGSPSGRTVGLDVLVCGGADADAKAIIRECTQAIDTPVVSVS